jgi:hypothetical protein
MITNMNDSPKEPKKVEPELTVHPATEPSPETKVRIAAELGQGLSEALEQAVDEHEDGGAPDVA